jgi:hypothetical protein
MPTSESNPTIYVCLEDKQTFIPLPPSKLMMNLSEDREKIDGLLEKLPQIHNTENNKGLQAEFALSCGILAAKEILNETGNLF